MSDGITESRKGTYFSNRIKISLVLKIGIWNEKDKKMEWFSKIK